MKNQRRTRRENAERRRKRGKFTDWI